MSAAHVVQLLEWRATPRVKEAPRGVGSAVIDGTCIRFDFPTMKLCSLNRSGFGMSRGAAMAEGARIRLIRETVRQSVERVVGAPLRPLWVRITRRSSGRIRDEADNLPGSCKAAIDGLAKGLGFDDSLFAAIPPKLQVILGDDVAGVARKVAAQGGIALFFAQAPSGARGVFGFSIELDFGKVGS